MGGRGFLRRVLLGLALAALATAAARAVPFAVGDVFAGVGQGQIKQFDPTGTLKATLDDTTGSTFITGMCFDPTGHLYATNFSTGTVSKFDNNGTLVSANFLTGLGSPESCVIDAAGNIYVGGPGQPISKFSSAGGASIATFAVSQGSDWIDLAADQCTLFYDNEGAVIHRFNACTNTQLADFSGTLAGRHFALRILPGGGVIVAAGSPPDSAQLLDATGAITSTYLAPGSSLIFALNRDPNGTQFWTGDLTGAGMVSKFNFAPVGPPVTTFNAVANSELAGLAVFGELLISQPTPTPGGGAQVVVPTLSGPMLALLGAALAVVALLTLIRR